MGSSLAPSLDRLVPAYVRLFEPYTPSRPDPELMRLNGVKRLIRLNNNENPLGPPKAAKAVLAAFKPERAAIYPSGDCYYLRQTLAEKFGASPEQFLVGNGSCEVIASVIKAFCQSGDNIVTADKTFAVYEWVAAFSGLAPKLVPLKGYGFDAAAMLAAADERTKVFFVCNPNNPTGTYWTTEQMTAFLDAVAGRQVVVIDEAYFEFVDKPDYPNGMRLAERYPNVIVFRTFSKMYALAGLRAGYLYGSPEAVDIVRRTHIVYSVNTLAQEAARAALADDADHIRATRAMVAAAKEQLTALFAAKGLEYVSGEGNYVMVKTPLPDSALYRKLIKREVMVRTMTGFRFPNWIRVTLGLPPDMEDFCRAFAAVIEPTRAHAS